MIIINLMDKNETTMGQITDKESDYWQRVRKLVKDQITGKGSDHLHRVRSLVNGRITGKG